MLDFFFCFQEKEYLNSQRNATELISEHLLSG